MDRQQGRRSRFTRADELSGKVVGKLQTSVSKSVTGLSRGTYDLYLLNTDSSWHAYYQSKGMVIEASWVEISQDEKPAGVNSKSEISPQSRPLTLGFRGTRLRNQSEILLTTLKIG